MSVEELKKTTQEIVLEYKDEINIPNVPFGIEIEFANAEFGKVRETLKQILDYDPVNITWDDKKKCIQDQYTKWNLKNDTTVQTHKKENIYLKFGGEVTSPIMKNEKQCWQELKLICDTLSKIENIEINNNCSIHIHTSKTIFDIFEEYKNLLKLIIVYEDVIFRFAYGEAYTPRALVTKYAKPMSYYLYENLEELERIEDEAGLFKLLKFDRQYSFNFMNLQPKSKQTLENRTGNPTFDSNFIQNDLLFNHNFLNYAKKENFDEEFINYKLKNYTPIFLNDSLKENTEKAIELSTIFKSEIDKLYFLKQYFKTYNENDIEKKYHL